MDNNFTQKTFDLFDMDGYCMSWETGKNNADCLHHVFGRISNSPFNAAPLNNKSDHMPEGRKSMLSLSSLKIRKQFLNKTKKYLESIDYQPTKNDLKFLQKYKSFY